MRRFFSMFITNYYNYGELEVLLRKPLNNKPIVQSQNKKL